MTAQKIISAVWRLNGRFGAGHVVDVVIGKRTDKVARGGHDQLSVFGLLADAGEQAVRAWIDQLAVQGHVAVVEDGVYSFLTMTEVGRGLCKGEGAVRLGRPVAKSKPARSSRRGDKGSGAKSGSDRSERASSSADDALFERLRALRRRLAERLGVPPYLVFTDVTLRALASERPATLEAMRGIKGIGETKLARYGTQFLPVIRGEDPDLSDAGT
ncbi:MAG: HRDC domain-containing protein [Planctomycetes bacterium]|nr:HRDC domain-containing protein [Planctomycetota bacterium]